MATLSLLWAGTGTGTGTDPELAAGDMDLFLSWYYSFMGESSYGTGAGGHDYEHERAYG